MRYAIRAENGYFVVEFGPLGFQLGHTKYDFSEKAQSVCDDLNARGGLQFEVIEYE